MLPQNATLKMQPWKRLTHVVRLENSIWMQQPVKKNANEFKEFKKENFQQGETPINQET